MRGLKQVRGMDPKFRTVPEPLWRTVAPLLPPERPKRKGGRPRVPDRVVLAGILYRLRTGCHSKALPSEFGSDSTCHLRLQKLARVGVFTDIFVASLECYNKRRCIAPKRTALDGFIVKAPKGGNSREQARRTAESGSLLQSRSTAVCLYGTRALATSTSPPGCW